MEKPKNEFDLGSAAHYLMRIDSKRTLTPLLVLWNRYDSLTSEIISKELCITQEAALSLMKRLIRILNERCALNIGFQIEMEFSKAQNAYGENTYELVPYENEALPPPEILGIDLDSAADEHPALELLRHKKQIQNLMRLLLTYPEKWFATHLLADLVPNRRHLNRNLRKLIEIIEAHPNPLGVKIEQRDSIGLSGKPSQDYRVVSCEVEDQSEKKWTPGHESKGPKILSLNRVDTNRFRRQIFIALRENEFHFHPPRNAEGLLENSAWLLREEKNEMDAVRELLRHALTANAMKGIEFRKASNIPDRAFFESLQTRTQINAEELGFAVVRVSTGYYSIFFTKEGQRNIDLALPFDYERIKDEIRLTTESGTPERRLAIKVAWTQSKGKPMIQAELASKLGFKAKETSELIREMHAERYANGFYPAKRGDHRVVLIQLDLDAIDKRNRFR